MSDVQRIRLEEVVGYFEDLEDPRSSINIKHPLVSVVVIALMAVLAGASGPTAIARWAEMKKDFLSNVLSLPNGAPRKDVFRLVLALLRRVPRQGDRIVFAGWRFEVLAMDGRRVEKVLARPEPAASRARRRGLPWGRPPRSWPAPVAARSSPR